jgi:rhamnogalacturonyl hydrolase YesR
LSITTRAEIITNHLLEMVEEELLVQSQDGLWTTMATSMLPANPTEIEEASASTPMMMWHECRGLTIRHRNQSRTLTTITDELKATAIRK